MSDSFHNSLWADGLRWLWETVAEAWEILREEFIDNLWTLQDNYNSPTDALFALLAEDDEAFDELMTPDTNNANPFIDYQSAMAQAQGVHVSRTMSTTATYEAAKGETLAEYRDKRDGLVSEYNENVWVALDDFNTTNQSLEVQDPWEILEQTMGRHIATLPPQPVLPLEKDIIVPIPASPDGLVVGSLEWERWRTARECELMEERWDRLLESRRQGATPKFEFVYVSDIPDHTPITQEQLALILAVRDIQWYQGFVRQVEIGKFTQKRESVAAMLDLIVNIGAGAVGDLREAESDFRTGHPVSGTANLGFAAAGVGGALKSLKKLLRIAGRAGDAAKLLKALKPIAANVNVKLLDTWKLLGAKLVKEPDEIAKLFQGTDAKKILELIDKSPNAAELHAVIKSKVAEIEKLFDDAAEGVAKREVATPTKVVTTSVPKRSSVKWVDDSGPARVFR